MSFVLSKLFVNFDGILYEIVKSGKIKIKIGDKILNCKKVAK